jgi:hypothetical protein
MATFNINYPGSPDEFVVNAKNTIKTKGGVFKGDQNFGSFSLKTLLGTVKGNYEILAKVGDSIQIAITITQKPLLVPVSKIQQVIQGYF